MNRNSFKFVLMADRKSQSKGSMKKFDDKQNPSLNDRIHVEVRHGSGSTERMINANVPLDVLNCFVHLPNLKRVESYVVGKSICVFDSKMNFE